MAIKLETKYLEGFLTAQKKDSVLEEAKRAAQSLRDVTCISPEMTGWRTWPTRTTVTSMPTAQCALPKGQSN